MARTRRKSFDDGGARLEAHALRRLEDAPAQPDRRIACTPSENEKRGDNTDGDAEKGEATSCQIEDEPRRKNGDGQDDGRIERKSGRIQSAPLGETEQK